MAAGSVAWSGWWPNSTVSWGFGLRSIKHKRSVDFLSEDERTVNSLTLNRTLTLRQYHVFEQPGFLITLELIPQESRSCCAWNRMTRICFRTFTDCSSSAEPFRPSYQIQYITYYKHSELLMHDILFKRHTIHVSLVDDDGWMKRFRWSADGNSFKLSNS